MFIERGKVLKHKATSIITAKNKPDDEHPTCTDLNVCGMLENRKLPRSIANAGRRMLKGSAIERPSRHLEVQEEQKNACQRIV